MSTLTRIIHPDPKTAAPRAGRCVRRTRTALAAALFCLTLCTPPCATGAERGSAYWQKHGGGYVVYSAHTPLRSVALTFDDGPDPRYTLPILQLLSRYRARATFFVIGTAVRAHPWLVREIHLAGHEIGNHTEHHRRQGPLDAAEILACDEDIAGLTGQAPTLLRPPGGNINHHILRLARQTRHKLIMWTWDVDAHDWAQPGAARIARTIIGHIHPGDIVIFHDGGGRRAQTVAALEMVLARLANERYRLETVSELLREEFQHKVRQ